MTKFESTAESTAWDEDSAREWAEHNRLRTSDHLSFPWKLAAATSSIDHDLTTVLDVASGPGGFLEAVLDYSPNASGVWFDFSEAMRQAAKTKLERFGDRVRYQTGDMTAVAEVGEEASFDLVTTSRATHHLLLPDLTKFYSSSFSRLKNGGWIANIDSVALSANWDTRLRLVRAKMEGPKQRSESSHPHPNPFPSLEDHLSALRIAGFNEPRVVWSSLVRVLLMAQKPSSNFQPES